MPLARALKGFGALEMLLCHRVKEQSQEYKKEHNHSSLIAFLSLSASVSPPSLSLSVSPLPFCLTLFSSRERVVCVRVFQSLSALQDIHS